jgi:hypothetical protein
MEDILNIGMKKGLISFDEERKTIYYNRQNILSQAKALQHEAAGVLEEAKCEVEKMILGE